MIVAALLLGGAPRAMAQQTKPTSAPAADLSTPQGSLLVLNEAMRDGDVEKIKQLFIATTPAEVKMVGSEAEMAAALADLRRAAVKVFGEEGAKTITGDSAAGQAESIARINSASVEITGDSATVVYRDQKDTPFLLKKVNGEWKVPVADLGKPLDVAALDQRLADLALQRKVVRELTAQIRANAFANAEQAREAWQTRILQAATSQPAPQPGGTRRTEE